LAMLLPWTQGLHIVSYHAERGVPEAPLVTSTLCVGAAKHGSVCPVVNLADPAVVTPIKGGIAKYDISGITKLRFLARYLRVLIKKGDGAEDIIFLDGSDVVYVGCGKGRGDGMAGILAHLQTQVDASRNASGGAQVVLGMEFNPYQVQGHAKGVPPWARRQCPFLNVRSLFPSEHYRYFNSGMVAGRVDVLLPMVAESIRIVGRNKQLGDQGAYQVWLNTHRNTTRAGGDYCATLVLNMARSNQGVVDDSFFSSSLLPEGPVVRWQLPQMEGGAGQVHKETELCFMHFNGWSKRNSKLFTKIKAKYHHV